MSNVKIVWFPELRISGNSNTGVIHVTTRDIVGDKSTSMSLSEARALKEALEKFLKNF